MPFLSPPRLAFASFVLALLMVSGGAKAAPQDPAPPSGIEQPGPADETATPSAPEPSAAPSQPEPASAPEAPAAPEPSAAPGAAAEPEAPKEAASDDEALAESFVGKTYAGELEIDGWTDLGGGLVSPPIYVQQFQRADGTFLVLTSRELAKATGNAPASLTVADALIVKPPKGGAEFTISCVQGKDEMLRFMGVAKGSPDKEWWSDVRQAWEIAVPTGEISTVKAKGVRCTNVSWGQ